MSTAGRPPVIVLLTDFGVEDPFVGIMKGVVLRLCPHARIVDLTHGVPPQDIATGAFWLERSHGWFEPGTIFVAVVDPGVGSAREGIVVRAHGKTFVGPDNGLIGRVATSDPSFEVYAIDEQRLALPPPSRTFHGRDVFAPVAARLAAGDVSPGTVGPRRGALTLLPGGIATRMGAVAEGAVVTIDHFGNAITNIDARDVLEGSVVEVCDKVVAIAGTYSDIEPGGIIGVINSFGVVEIAKRNGNAAAELNLGVGSKVVVRPAPT